MSANQLSKRVSSCGDWVLYGADDAEIVLAGHSHVFSMYSAIKEDPKKYQNFSVVIQSDFDHHIQPGETYWDFVSQLADEFQIYIVWNGNQHNIHFLIESGFNFESMNYKNGFGLPFITFNHIKELFQPTFTELENVLKKFNKNKKIKLLGTPAPKDKLFMDKILKSDDFFVNLGESQGISKSELEVSSNELRGYMWKITQTLTKEVASRYNFDFIESPADTYDSDNILKKEFYADDLTHTNSNYGKIFLDELNLDLELKS